MICQAACKELPYGTLQISLQPYIRRVVRFCTENLLMSTRITSVETCWVVCESFFFCRWSLGYECKLRLLCCVKPGQVQTVCRERLLVLKFESNSKEQDTFWDQQKCNRCLGCCFNVILSRPTLASLQMALDHCATIKFSETPPWNHASKIGWDPPQQLRFGATVQPSYLGLRRRSQSLRCCFKRPKLVVKTRRGVELSFGWC